jgi:hypothetical protein
MQTRAKVIVLTPPANKRFVEAIDSFVVASPNGEVIAAELRSKRVTDRFVELRLTGVDKMP